MSEMHDMIAAPQGEQQLSTTEVSAALSAMLKMMEQMGNAIAAVSEGMASLTHRMDMMDRLTPGQAKALGEAIRRRGEQLTDEYGMHGKDALSRIQAAIRKELRNSVGAEGKSLRDLPKCEYQVMLTRVSLWEDYDVLTDIRRRTT